MIKRKKEVNMAMIGFNGTDLIKVPWLAHALLFYYCIILLYIDNITYAFNF